MTSSPGEPTPASNLTLEELLRQHDVIRDLCARCDELVEAVEQTPSQSAPVGQLVSAVARLRWAVSTHNRLEEQMLSPMLQSAPPAEQGARAEAGAAGPHAGCCAAAASPPLEQRVAAHRAEHHDIGLRLERLNLDSLRETLRLLREHLEDEECHFLAPRPPRERRRTRATTARP